MNPFAESAGTALPAVNPRQHLHRWCQLAVIGIALLLATLAHNWDWLASVGLAPIVIATLWTTATGAVGVYLVRREHRKRFE